MPIDFSVGHLMPFGVARGYKVESTCESYY